jgi:hypothetical protein
MTAGRETDRPVVVSDDGQPDLPEWRPCRIARRRPAQLLGMTAAHGGPAHVAAILLERQLRFVTPTAGHNSSICALAASEWLVPGGLQIE